MSINKVILVGRLTKNPEFSMTPNGIEKATFTLAVNRTFSNNQGEKEADFINCIVWRKQAVNVNNYLQKGSLAGVDGRIQTGSYEGQDGKRVYTTDVVAESVQFLDTKKQEEQQQNSNFGRTTEQSMRAQSFDYNKVAGDPFANMGGKIDITEDDLPF